MITGNEPYEPVTTETMGIGGLTIRQELSVRFMAAYAGCGDGFVQSACMPEFAKQSCALADALIAEWNSSPSTT